MTSFGDEKTNNHCGWSNGERCREKRDSTDYRAVAFHGFEVEGHVVKYAPENEAVDDGVEIGDVGGTVCEDSEPYHRLGRKISLVDAEGYQASDTDEQWDESAPGRPGVHHAAPGYWDKE